VSELTEIVLRAVAIGVGATVVMDLWAVLLQRLFNIPPSNWAMVGRWVGHFSNGKFRHDRIADAPPIHGELALGWMVHYITGITYGALLRLRIRMRRGFAACSTTRSSAWDFTSLPGCALEDSRCVQFRTARFRRHFTQRTAGLIPRRLA
jgi:hypothetical protein